MELKNKELIGLVLCGGMSERMGSDKGLIQNNNISWSIFGFGKLSATNLNIYVSVNSSQLTEYEDLFHKDLLIVDKENVSIRGPLLGLLSAHLQFPDKNILVLACDMLDITNENINLLISKFDGQNALCYKFKDSPEPLLAIYSYSALQLIFEKYESGQLMKFSMMHVLDELSADFIDLSDEDFVAFKNYNSPQDLIK
jgi:molybdenum cofactor guanylyltransferase